MLDRRAFSLLCLSVAAVLVLHASHLPLWLSGVLALLIALRWLQQRRGGHVPTLLRLSLVALLLATVIATYGTLFGRAPGAAFAVGLLVLKLLESERPRDARATVLFAAFLLMSALLFGQGLPMTLLVAAALLPLLATLTALQPAPGVDARRVLWSAPALLLAAALPAALLGFVFVPRLSTPLWGAPADTTARTGIGDTMTPGEYTQLLVDDSPAFRVGFDGPVPPRAERYFRGVVMEHFDGRTWSNSGSGQLGPAVEAMRPIAPVVRYTVTLEPTQRHLLFALDTPLDAPAGATLTRARTLLRAKPVDTRLRYDAVSAPQHILEPVLTPAARRLGLQLPAGFDPRARALAAQWRARYGHDDAAIVQAALRMFHDGGFRYTLAPPPLGRNSVDDFLFDTRSGFCEHYASTFTFLMRAAGIPARVIGGYQGGFHNRLGHYLLVRQSDAHAWSEVWLPGRGWTRIDPTAAVRPDRISLGAGAADAGSGAWYQADWLRGLRNRIDIVNRLWDQTVIGFNALRQRGLLTRFGVDDSDWRSLAGLLAGSAGVLMAIGLALALYERPRGDALTRGFARLQRRLERCGLPRRPGEGPRDYLLRAAGHLDATDAAQLLALMATYLQLRYGVLYPTVETVHDWIQAVTKFRPRPVVQSDAAS